MKLKGTDVPVVATERAAAPGLFDEAGLPPASRARHMAASALQAAVGTLALSQLKLGAPMTRTHRYRNSLSAGTCLGERAKADRAPGLEPVAYQPMTDARGAAAELVCDLADRQAGFDERSELVAGQHPPRRVL